MLEILHCPSADTKRDWLNAFDPKSETWVVSDLQSKWYLQEFLLQKHQVLEQNSILRATELWRHLAFQKMPHLKILSHELAQTLLWQWIQPLDLPWARSPLVVSSVLREMQMWIGVFANPNFPEIMAGWFQENPDSYVRWGSWFELCAHLWRRCQEEGWVMATWLPGVVLATDLTDVKWPKRITFDLGPQISQVEGQLIKDLASRLNTRLIYPAAEWSSLMPSPVRPYEDLLDRPFKGNPSWSPSVQSAVEFGRFSTQLAEVKDTVARVRQWLEKGISPQKIAIVAPDIEHYWPILRLYLLQEGIPTQKAQSEKLGAFAEMAHWTANLRTRLQKVSSSDLETFLFGQESPSLSYDEFKVLFTHVYDARDLKRAESLFLNAASLKVQDSVTLTEFLAWALAAWNANRPDTRLLALLQILAQEVPHRLMLQPGQWLSYLEGLLARREIKVADGSDDGILCLSLSSTGWIQAEYAVFLNVSESALRSIDNSPVSRSEIQKIFTDTGFSLGATDRQELEFEFLWFLQRPWKELRLNFSVTDFEGQTLTPSRFWIWAGFRNGKLKREPDSPLPSRWDEIQKNFPKDDLNPAFARDRDVTVSSWRAVDSEKFSASGLERYAKCPFIFAAEKRLRLSDDPTMDLDLDRRSRGAFLHAILEALGVEPFQADRSDADLQALIEKIWATGEFKLGEERLWPAIKAEHLRLARLFLNFEAEWRKRFPETKTVGREVGFEGYWNLETSKPQKETTPIRFSGRLDRVDQDKDGRYALIDYKGSAYHLTGWSKWVEKRSFQMPLYALVLESGLTDLPPGPVAAANYYIVKDLERHKGFCLKDDSAALYDNNAKHRNFISEAQKAELYEGIGQQISEVLKATLAGEFKPIPVDKKNCHSCTWKGLCRAPHLN